jgi:hypothetical protein
MFGWFSSSACPVEPPAKAWVEEQFDWLGTEFAGGSRRPRPVVPPTDESFPDRYDRSPATVRALFNRVCEFMDVDPERVRVRLYSESNRPMLVNAAGDVMAGTAGTFEEGDTDNRFIVRLEKSQLENPMDLVGTVAHELAHVRLLGEGRVMAERFDHELLTDLTAVYFGFGIFLANSPRDWKSGYGVWPGTDVARPEYMSLPMHAYALAQVAVRRAEQQPPPWMKHLKWDARVLFKQAMRFLQRGGA